MENPAQLLKEHFNRHPEMELQDAIKFLYQIHMGPGHLIADECRALAWLDDEWNRTEASPSAPLTEPLGGGLCRLQLGACKGSGLSSMTAFRLVLLTARQFPGNPAALDRDLNLLYTLPFSREEVNRTLTAYRARGCPALSHSRRYRDAYAPAYRLISTHLARLLPLLCAIDQQRAQSASLRVAIDGPCASGKSTLGADLAELYQSPLIHMDDFFLRPEQRTPARLDQPGGNVDWERFDREVLSPLCRGEAARFCPWLCREGAFGPEITVKPSSLTIIEGSYSLHPALRDRLQLRVWVEADMDTRLARLARRGGPGCLERFRQMWIPLEDRYFQACRVRECCHICISGEEQH